jgi:hypothetical protein
MYEIDNFDDDEICDMFKCLACSRSDVHSKQFGVLTSRVLTSRVKNEITPIIADLKSGGHLLSSSRPRGSYNKNIFNDLNDGS